MLDLELLILLFWVELVLLLLMLLLLLVCLVELSRSIYRLLGATLGGL